MRIGGSLFLIAIGAILRFAITTHNTHGFNVGTAGVILMIIGGIGLLVTGIWMTSRRRTDVITRSPMGSRRTTYVEPNPMDEPY